MKNLTRFILLIGTLLIFSCASNEKITDFKKEEKKDYKLEKVVYQIKDNNLRDLLQNQEKKTEFIKVNQ